MSNVAKRVHSPSSMARPGISSRFPDSASVNADLCTANHCSSLVGGVAAALNTASEAGIVTASMMSRLLPTNLNDGAAAAAGEVDIASAAGGCFEQPAI